MNEQDEKGYTALHHAISSKDVHKARMLIQHGVDTKIRTYSQLTPYDLASSSQLKRLLDPNLPSEISEKSSEDGSYENSLKDVQNAKDLSTQVKNNQNKLIDKLNFLKNGLGESKRFDYNKITNTKSPNSAFYSNLRNTIDTKDRTHNVSNLNKYEGGMREEVAKPLSRMSNTVVHDDKQENEHTVKRSLSRISESVKDAPVKRTNRSMYQSDGEGSRKGAVSVKRTAKAGIDDHTKPFYLPDVKANYSEYSKYDGSYAIPKSLKQFREYTSHSYTPAAHRFQTPIKKVKNL